MSSQSSPPSLFHFCCCIWHACLAFHSFQAAWLSHVLDVFNWCLWGLVCFVYSICCCRMHLYQTVPKLLMGSICQSRLLVQLKSTQLERYILPFFCNFEKFDFYTYRLGNYTFVANRFLYGGFTSYMQCQFMTWSPFSYSQNICVKGLMYCNSWF